MQKSSLGDRMKKYEEIPRIYLTPRLPTIIRIDGKAFHTYTKGFNKPFDQSIRNALIDAGKELIDQIQCSKIVYIQSDELSILINDYEKFDTQPWFDKNLQKIVSISSSICTAYFNRSMWTAGKQKVALFDSRAFVVPREEVCNYFIWRQQDAERNSVSSLAQSQFSHKLLHKKSVEDIKKMLLTEKGIDWDTLPTAQKRGWCVLKDGTVDFEIPRFQENREYINQLTEQIET